MLYDSKNMTFWKRQTIKAIKSLVAVETLYMTL